MLQHLSLLMAQYGLLMVFATVLLEQVGLPVPAMPVLVIAGALAAAGHLPLAGIGLLAILACLLGDSAWYLAGRRYGARVTRTLCRVSLSPDSCIHQSELHFQRWGGWSLVIAKFIPGLSLIAPPLVGALRLRARSFLWLDTLGAVLWVGVATALGWAFAGQIDSLLALLGQVGTRVFELALAALALYVATKWWWRRRVRKALGMARISVADLHAAVVAGRAPIIIDVRSQVSRTLDPHVIEGALLLDTEAAAATLEDTPRDREIVSYCDCPNEATSARAASVLLRRGFRHVRPLLGGLEAWKAAGYATRLLGAPHGDNAPPTRDATAGAHAER